MILNLTRKNCGKFWLYKALVCHRNTEVVGQGATAEEAIKNMAEGIRDDWHESPALRDEGDSASSIASRGYADDVGGGGKP